MPINWILEHKPQQLDGFNSHEHRWFIIGVCNLLVLSLDYTRGQFPVSRFMLILDTILVKLC